MAANGLQPVLVVAGSESVIQRLESDPCGVQKLDLIQPEQFIAAVAAFPLVSLYVDISQRCREISNLRSRRLAPALRYDMLQTVSSYSKPSSPSLPPPSVFGRKRVPVLWSRLCRGAASWWGWGPVYDKTVSRPVALFFEWLVIPVRCRSPLAPGTLSEPPELHFKRILAKTVICSAAQLICAAADVNPTGVLAHSVQFGT